MPHKKLTERFLSEFSTELSLLIRAGVTLSDGLDAIAEDFDDPTGFIDDLRRSAAGGSDLHTALKSTGRAPSYMLDTVRLGERTGRLDACLASLADYYDRRANLASAVKSALLYPFVLIIMLAAVMAVLVLKVLPIFSDVFAQMGVQLSTVSQGFVSFGRALAAVASIIIGVLAIVVILTMIIYAIPKTRDAAVNMFRTYFGGKGIVREMLTAQFASAMSAAIASGLGPDESVELAGQVISGVKATDENLAACREMLKNGEKLENALETTGLFTARDCRLLALGERTGTADSVMADIASRSEERALEDVDSRISRIEPTLVVIISVVITAVLLAVMLPLAGIMSSLG